MSETKATRTKARSVAHAEFEIFNTILHGVPITELQQHLVADNVSEARFNKAAQNVATILKNARDRRRYKLPKDHPEFQARDD
jgi:hypothetical protein